MLTIKNKELKVKLLGEVFVTFLQLCLSISAASLQKHWKLHQPE